MNMQQALNNYNVIGSSGMGVLVGNMDTVTLYKLDTKGKQRQWSVTVVANGDYSADIIIETGLVDGKKVTQVITITEGKNIGKANETTPYTQAVSEAKAKVELQLRSGYVENLTDVKASGTLGSGIMSPMLAQKYDPTGKQSGSKTLDKMKIRGHKIHVQPKLDGNRCLIKVESTASGVKAGMYTRKGDFMPVQLQHILLRVLEEAGSTTDVVLDGELFSTELSFNELNGHLKRKDSQDYEALAKIKFHLYDVMVDEPYTKRYEMLQKFNGGGIEVIPSFEITATDEAINEKLEEFLAEGHEGLMIRTLDSGYEHKRSWSLCKVKLFEDEEFEIIDFELNAMGRLGGVVCKLSEPVKDRDGKVITEFRAGLGKGISHEDGMNLLINKESFIGKLATVEFFGRSEYFVPRFGKLKKFNRTDV